jgi:CRISPR-associated endonuclease/helicase Cas3
LVSNNYKYPFLAKPSGITLEEHTKNVISEGKQLLNTTPFVVHKYQEFVGKSLIKRLELICKYHDIGKATSKWQTACQKDYENYLQWQEQTDGAFQEYSKNKNAGENIRNAGVRHEFQSLRLTEKTNLPTPLQTAIAAHHKKLGIDSENRWVRENMSDFWTKFRKLSNDTIEQYSIEKSAKAFYEYAGLRGLLQLVDHRASAKEEGIDVPNFTEFIYKFPHKEKRGVQKLIEQHWKDELLLVRAPTGAGKTDASLLWAALQIENNRADRLVVAMPTRFTSNALAINVAESLSDTGLYHSSAWFTKFSESIKRKEVDKQQAKALHEFARLLQTPITVCTIDHLLMSLTLTREDHHLIAFNLANSCLVIDEADFYDEFTQANILILLKILRYWKVPVLLMSASIPNSTLPQFLKTGYLVKQILEDNSDSERIRFEIKSIQNYSKVNELENLLELCLSVGTAIIYVNTIDRAIQFADWFEERGFTPVIYHSRFTEPHKKDKENELITLLGKNAWEKNHAHGIAILTQIGEMSINISADIMISEICPIDRLTQRAGRLCRFDKNKIGQLHIVKPFKNDDIYPAPYGEYNNKTKSWIPCDGLIKTIDSLELGKYNSIKLVTMLNSVYSEDLSFSPTSLSNAKSLKEYFSNNWLINPKSISSTDDTETTFWRSRNIPPQETIFVCKPDREYFSSYLTFMEWKIQNSIEIPIYLIEKFQKKHILSYTDIYINDGKEKIIVINEGFYNYEKGIVIPDEINVFL